MEDLDNPAKRLLEILKNAKATKPDTNCRQAWHSLLQTQGNESLLMSRLGKVMALPMDVHASMHRHYPSRIAMTSHWMGQVNTAFANQQFGGNIQSFSQHIDTHTLNYLELTAELLANREQVALLPLDDVANLRTRMVDLLSEVLKSDLALKVKDAMTRYLQRLIVALEEYSISGALPIVDAMESAFGRVAYDPEYRSALTETPTGKSFVEVLSATANLVTVVIALPQLADGATHLTKLLGLG